MQRVLVGPLGSFTGSQPGLQRRAMAGIPLILALVMPGTIKRSLVGGEEPILPLRCSNPDASGVLLPSDVGRLNPYSTSQVHEPESAILKHFSLLKKKVISMKIMLTHPGFLKKYARLVLGALVVFSLAAALVQHTKPVHAASSTVFFVNAANYTTQPVSIGVNGTRLAYTCIYINAAVNGNSIQVVNQPSPSTVTARLYKTGNCRGKSVASFRLTITRASSYPKNCYIFLDTYGFSTYRCKY